MHIKNEQGFTLIELLVVVAIIGILASVALPNFSDYRRRANIAATASEIRGLISTFYAYDAENGKFPDDFHNMLPAGMRKYISQDFWSAATPMGGYYNWEGENFYPYSAVSIYNCPAPTSELRTLDAMLDDGNLATGKFRTGVNGRPSYIIQWK